MPTGSWDLIWFFSYSFQMLEVRRFPKLHDRIVDVVSSLLQNRVNPTNQMVSQERTQLHDDAVKC